MIPLARQLAALTLACTLACAQPDTEGMSAQALERAGVQAVQDNRLDDAEAYFQAQAEADQDSPIPWYNLAAVACLRSDPDLAQRHMVRSIGMGFCDIRAIRRDPQLAVLRDTQFYKDLDKGWGDVLNAHHNADQARAERLVPSGRTQRTIDRWKLELVSAHDDTSTDEAAAELALICGWSATTLFTRLDQPDAFAEDPWAFVVLPDRAGFAKWAVDAFGPGARGGISSIGGAYDHNRRRLVAQDLGATLRHELVHVMHWRDMSRLGQEHAAWVQEGLASLVEDYDLRDGTLECAPSWRTNIVKRLGDSGRLPTIEQLAATPLDRFVASRPLARYAHARAVMLFLLDRGKLTEFYDRYTKTYDRDPTALTALRDTLGMTQADAEAAFRDWLTALPTVAETGSDLSATLGVEVENGTGDGVRVTDLPPGARQRTNLHLGSFITAVNNRPTRDLFELIRVLSDYAPGDKVTLSVRRGKVRSTAEVELQPRDTTPRDPTP